jgi:VIT1/CCC1 family predicted Fe2+/Mn2+ transporter/rubrerythrin
VTSFDASQSLENLRLERDAIVLYDELARIERDERRADAFRRIAANERRHADIWATKLREAGVEVPPAGRPRLRVRVIIGLARVFGTRAVADLVQALEGDEEEIYQGQGVSPEVAGIAADEREHAEIWKRLDAAAGAKTAGRRPAAADAATTGRAAPGRSATPAVAAALVEQGGALAEIAATDRDGVDAAQRARTPAEIGAGEHWHRSSGSGTIRAVIFGVSDGLVSNLSLVMGVVGAASSQPTFILLAGIAGLLAGAFSMAAGEYISMQSQRELFERQIELERAELEIMPEEEEAELAAVYRSKGFTEEEAVRIAHRLFQDPETALDTLVREELGLDPDQLGSPWGAAFGSFMAFAAGAAVPVVPFLLAGGEVAFVASLGLSLAALFGVGAGVSLLTGRSTLFSGARQVAIGLAAAAVTFVVGRWIGVAVAG